MIHEIRGAFRSLNARGRGPETFRKVWRNGQWQWVSGYLPRGTVLASDRRASTEGPVATGEIVAEFSRNLPDRKCSLDGFYLLQDDPSDTSQPYRLAKLAHVRKTLSTYALTGEGVEPVEVTDPLARG